MENKLDNTLKLNEIHEDTDKKLQSILKEYRERPIKYALLLFSSLIKLSALVLIFGCNQLALKIGIIGFFGYLSSIIFHIIHYSYVKWNEIINLKKSEKN